MFPGQLEAVGVALDMECVEVEDASWMRKKEFNHINEMKLEANLKGVKFCIGVKFPCIQERLSHVQPVSLFQHWSPGP